MKNLKSILTIATATVIIFSSFTFSACKDSGEDVAEEITQEINAEQWKSAFEKSRNAKSYSYRCVYNAKEYSSTEGVEDSNRLRADINSNLEGKADKINGIYYYQFTDSGSVFPNGSNTGYMFGKYYGLEGKNVFYAAENEDGSFKEWEKINASSSAFDVLNSLLLDTIKYTVEDENGEKLKLHISELFEYFTFDEQSQRYCAKLQIDERTEQDVKLSFRNGKIYNFDLITCSYGVTKYDPVEDENDATDTSASTDANDDAETSVVRTTMLISYRFIFYGYNGTVASLPEELKNLINEPTSQA